MDTRFATVLFACIVGCGVARTAWPREDADRPSKPDATCAYLGEGYRRPPGSNTCVRVGGSVRFEGQATWSR